MSLGQIRNGELVVIDTNILVYANQQKSGECVHLLQRCAGDEVNGIVPMPMVAELMHTLMLIEAKENGWIERANPSRALAERPERVQRLSNYEKQMHQFLGIGLRLESVAAGPTTASRTRFNEIRQRDPHRDFRFAQFL